MKHNLVGVLVCAALTLALASCAQISAISDLYNAAQYQASGLNRFIDGLIGGEQGQ